MFCGECGAELRADAVRCPVCGTNVSEHYVPQEGEQESVVAHQPKVHEDQSVSQKSGIGKLVIAVVVLAVTVGVGAVALKHVIKNRDKDKTVDMVYSEADAEVEHEESDTYESAEEDGWASAEEDGWETAEEADDPEEAQIPELRAALDLSYDEIDPNTLPEDEGILMVIGDYIYVSPYDQEGLLVLDQNLEMVAKILPDATPMFYTDGRYIYYAYEDTVYRADPDGTNVTQVVTHYGESIYSFVSMNGFLYYTSYDSDTDTIVCRRLDMESGNEKEICTSDWLVLSRYQDQVFVRDGNDQWYNADTGEVQESEELEKLLWGWFGWEVYPLMDDSSLYFDYLTDQEGNKLYEFAEGEHGVFVDQAGDYVYCLSQNDEKYESCMGYLYRISTGEMKTIDFAVEY